MIQLSEEQINSLCFIVTEKCNFKCKYCYQTQGNQNIDESTIEKSIDFFYPYLDKKDTGIVFFGGEPLLVFDRIRYTVEYIEKKNKNRTNNFNYYVTTNGSLITPEMLDFFEKNRFNLTLSFDAFNQDNTRKDGTFESLLKIIENKSQSTDLSFATNTVFTPSTVDYLSESLQFIIGRGVSELLVSLAANLPWDEDSLERLTAQYDQLVDFLIEHYKKTGNIPIREFQTPPGSEKAEKPTDVFRCLAGARRVSISPEGEVLGCYLFHDYLKTRKDHEDFNRFSFGKLDNFINNHETIYPKVIVNYLELQQDNFYTDKQDCFLCPDVDRCRTCPVMAAYITSSVGEIHTLLCRQNQIQWNARGKFHKAIQI